MNSSIEAGLATDLPPPQWLEDGQGQRMAFSAYPASTPWLHLLISHGFAEHRGWYHHVAQGFRDAGISTYTFDHFHHGMSDGRRGDVPSYDVLTGGLRLALQQGVLPRCGTEQPLALLGHSNGGLTVLLGLRELPPGRVSALVLCNPLLGLPPRMVLWGGVVAALLGWIAPAIKVPVRTLPWKLTRNRAIWPQFFKDPLRLRGLSARFFSAMITAAKQARGEADCAGLPLLLLFGERDRVVHRAATRDWFERLNTPHKDMIAYPKLRHELFNEREWATVVKDAADWLKEELASCSASPHSGSSQHSQA
ncbi:MAG: lysophospholipase [SAR324 cluster bacterium]|nr:lysophospholipase [SAR324 cluster bacterium]